MKKLLSLTTAVLALECSAASVDAATIVDTSVLNVRQGPSTNTAIIGKVTKGQELQVTGKQAGWLAITYNGTAAYVSSEYTKETDTTVSSTAFVTADVLNVRSGAGTNYSVIGQLRNGQAVTVTGELGNSWLQIRFNNSTAYVSKQFISQSKIEQTPSIPTSNETFSYKYYVNADALNIRSGAGTNYSVVGQLRRGHAVNVANDMGNGWVKIHFNGTTAYASKQFISQSQVKIGQEFVVEATAYTPYDGAISGITAAGYNVGENPNMKLIAVDPNVIPLGTRVWVNGYGEAIAGDTGGLIKGNIIDVLMPTTAQALQWGRKNVTIRILD